MIWKQQCTLQILDTSAGVFWTPNGWECAFCIRLPESIQQETRTLKTIIDLMRAGV
jgi:hypothetical protein